MGPSAVRKTQRARPHVVSKIPVKLSGRGIIPERRPSLGSVMSAFGGVKRTATAPIDVSREMTRARYILKDYFVLIRDPVARRHQREVRVRLTTLPFS